MDAIRTRGLTKTYGKARGVTGLDLTVGEGDFFGFIGPNGAGKSTTIRTLLGLISPTSGKVEIFEKDITADRGGGRRDIGYLPSEAAFYSGMKAADILKLSAGLRNTDCAAEAERLCERLQLDVSRKADELSFGNRKKLGIVCAMQHLPRLLILDEPTGGLDPLMQREFFALLRERNAAGTTIFLSSHVLSEIQRNCRRAAIIREGRIIACDSVENLSRTSAKRVMVHGAFDSSGLTGVRDRRDADEGISFLFNGDINELIRALAAQSIEDLSISEPDLEEIFLHYYSEGGDGK